MSYAAESADENAPQGAYVFGMLQARELPQINLPEEFLSLNISGARYNIEKAAYMGFAKAQAKMGAAYELCQLGCDFEPALSLHYNALAAKQGEADADMAISKWFLCGYEGVFEKNEALAFTYAERAAHEGLATAEFAMGYFYEVGIHVPADHRAARSWYEKAAEHGNKDAAARVDGIARSKTLSRKDHDNVAVAKIKSQYGSHRGKRPDRFNNTVSHMPTMEEDYNPIDMPEPKLPEPRPGEYRPSPYGAMKASNTRPPTLAPYPIDDGVGLPSIPPSKPTLQTQRSNQNLRPRPHAPTSPAESESSFGDHNYRGSAFPTFKPQPRPQTHAAASSQGPGARGRSPQSRPPQNPPIHNHSMQNAPLNVPPQTYPSSNVIASGHRKPSGGSHVSTQEPISPAMSPAMNAQRPQTAQPPAIDIGFSAPPDFSGADRPKRLQKPMGSPGGVASSSPVLSGKSSFDASASQVPGPRKSSHDLSAGRYQDSLQAPQGLPHPSTMPIQGHRMESPSRRPVTASRPGPPPHVATQPIVPSQGVSLHDGPLPVPHRPKPHASASTPAQPVSGARPPGKGPKTFQEMGVPIHKKEEDCVSSLQFAKGLPRILTKI